MAIGQLRFDTEMVRIVTICTLSGVALAFGMSVGLGTRDITRNVLAGFYARKIFRPGYPIEIRGHRGLLRAITATQTLIDQDTGLVSVANSAFLDETIRQVSPIADRRGEPNSRGCFHLQPRDFFELARVLRSRGRNAVGTATDGSKCRRRRRHSAKEIMMDACDCHAAPRGAGQPDRQASADDECARDARFRRARGRTLEHRSGFSTGWARGCRLVVGGHGPKRIHLFHRVEAGAWFGPPTCGSWPSRPECPWTRPHASFRNCCRR